MMLRNNHRGDTLVEVLLAIAILSSVVGIAYSTSSQAQRNNQLVQERSEATNIAQTQIERLRKIRDTGDMTEAQFASFFSAYSVNGTFCVPASPSLPPKKTVDLKTSAANTNDCKTGTDNRYLISNTFNATSRILRSVVSWRAAGSNAPESVTLVNRLW